MAVADVVKAEITLDVFSELDSVPCIAKLRLSCSTAEI
jgi:hypothetical protein